MTSEGEDTDKLLSHSPQYNSDAGGEVTPTVSCRGVHILRRQWRLIVILGTPILLSPLPLSLHTSASRAAYCIAIIAVYWVTEALPIAVTALLPLWLFPALGVLSAVATAQNYLSDTNMLFVGGLMVALAIEKWNLHKRIALLVLLAVGSKPRWLLLGFMATTAFLSMWISNTATAAMMLAIAHAVLRELDEETSIIPHTRGNEEPLQSPVKIVYAKRYNGAGELKEEVSVQMKREGGEEGREDKEGRGGGREWREDREGRGDDKDEREGRGGGREDEGREGKQESLLETEGSCGEGDKREDDHKTRGEPNNTLQRMSKVLVLGVAYAANIGGTATLTGTGPNIVLSGLSVSLFPESGGINFGLWFIFATPAMLLALFLSWLYLSLLYCDDSFQWCKRRLLKRTVHTFHTHRANTVIREQYRKLGKIKYAEVIVLVLFILLALLWLFREPRFIPGWATIFPSENGKSYFSDASTAMFIVFLMFVIPSRPPWSSGCSTAPCPALLDWNTVQSKLAWNVVVLLGSGFALSAGAKESGLSTWIGSQLLSLHQLPAPVIALCVSVIIASVTEVMSNVATTTLFLPVLAQLAVELETNPLYFMIPATVSASYAFMLPVATPPNAMAFSYGYLKVYDMVLTGFIMNLMCVAIVTLVLNTTGRLIFNLDHFPSWAGNLTTQPVCLQWTNLNLTAAISSA